MPFISTGDAVFDFTAIDNLFFIDHMAGAPANALKVYLYSRMLALHPELGGMSELSSTLALSDDELYQAFDYWVNRGLMEKTGDNPPQYRFVPLTAANRVEKDSYYEYRSFNNALGALFPDSSRHMGPAQYNKAQEWISLGFSQSAVIALVKGTIAKSRSKNPYPASIFNAADKTALKLLDDECTSADDVIAYFDKSVTANNLAQAVISRLGMHRSPTAPEAQLAEKWLGQWRMTPETVLEACDRTVSAQNPSFGYLDAILKAMTPEGELENRVSEVMARLTGRRSASKVHVEWYQKRTGEGFEHETLLFAAEQQGKRRNNSLSGLDWLLDRWKENGALTLADAKKYVNANRAVANELNSMAYKGEPARKLSEDEVYAYARLREGFPHETLEYLSSLAENKKDPVGYIINRLGRWKEAGLFEKDAVIAAGSKKPAEAKTNPATDYEQRVYSDDEFTSGDYMREAEEFMRKMKGEGQDGQTGSH